MKHRDDMTRFAVTAYGERFEIHSELRDSKMLFGEVFPEPCRETGGSPLSITIEGCHSADASLEAARTVHTIQDGTFTLSLKEQRLVEIDDRTGNVIVRIDPRWIRSSPDLVKSLLIEAPVLVSLAWWRMPYVHAAAVSWNGRGYILAGGSGSGKSSLAYACTQIGFHYLAEDYLFVSPSTAGGQLRGVPTRMRLCSSALRFFPELRSVPTRIQPNGEHKLDAAAAVPEWNRCYRADYGGIFVLSPSTEPLPAQSHGRMSASDLLHTLVSDLMFDGEGMMDRYEGQLRRLTRDGAELLPMTPTPRQRARRLKDLISKS